MIALRKTEFWTYVGEIVASNQRFAVWEKRYLKTAKKLRKKIKQMGISCDRIATDDWDTFIAAFAEDNHKTGKEHTMGIEGNNCRLRHRARRAFRKTCCFSKKLFNHLKAFNMAFFYINYGLFDSHHTL
jgi:IS1 family transposase